MSQAKGGLQSRILALLLLLLSVMVLGAAVVVPLVSANRHYSGEIEGMESRLEILRRSAGIGESLKSEFEQLKRRQARDIHYLKSNSDTLAAAELQQIIKRAITPAGGELISTQSLSSKKEAGATRVTLKVRMKGELDKVVAVFYALETGKPFLFLDNISFRAKPSRRARPTGKEGVVVPPQELDVNFELSGYVREAES
jgi:general secretion pathway protein M